MFGELDLKRKWKMVVYLYERETHMKKNKEFESRGSVESSI